MVSRPAFDPNLFAGRIRSKDWKDLVDNPAHPLMNRAIQAQQAPGSTFKPIMLLAGLETGAIDDNFHITCPRRRNLLRPLLQVLGQAWNGRVCTRGWCIPATRSSTTWVTGWISTISRNTPRWSGYGHKTGIDLPHEAEGVVPSRRWKIRTLHEKWFAGENISVAIGQGATTVTPLQMAAAIGGIAIGGMWFQPHLVPEARLHTGAPRGRRTSRTSGRSSPACTAW